MFPGSPHFPLSQLHPPMQIARDALLACTEVGLPAFGGEPHCQERCHQAESTSHPSCPTTGLLFVYNIYMIQQKLWNLHFLFAYFAHHSGGECNRMLIFRFFFQVCRWFAFAKIIRNIRRSANATVFYCFLPPFVVCIGSLLCGGVQNPFTVPSQLRLSLTPIGLVPNIESFDCSGLEISHDAMQRLVSVDGGEWLQEIQGVRQYYQQFAERLPAVLQDELASLEKRLSTYDHVPTTNQQIIQFVADTKALCTPANVHWASGTEQEYHAGFFFSL